MHPIGQELSFATISFYSLSYAAKRIDARAHQWWDVLPLCACIDLFAATVVPAHDVALCATPEAELALRSRYKNYGRQCAEHDRGRRNGASPSRKAVTPAWEAAISVLSL